MQPLWPALPSFEADNIIDRLYPPTGLALRYPIQIELTEEELNLAADGSFVTRVIYVEEPATALPVRQYEEQPWIEAPHGVDPLVMADEMGRPVAILRIGGRKPRQNNATLPPCDPPFIYYDPASCAVTDVQ